ncbi:MAG: hypothetical protein JXB35_04935 [Anaerolineae bacterium]|nr:hypothetical protein [Anaerolineae bacterium]
MDKVNRDLSNRTEDVPRDRRFKIGEEVVGVEKPTTRSEALAFWVSNLGSPPVVVLITLVILAAHTSPPGRWVWAGVYTGLAIVFPTAFLIALVKRGKVTDIDVQLRRQRYLPFIVTLSSAAVALAFMLLGNAPRSLIQLACASIVQGLLAFAITLRWKISLHTSTAAGMVILILEAVGPLAAPVLIAIPFIAWSRVKLRRHTPLQTIAGMGLGFATFLTTIYFLPA